MNIMYVKFIGFLNEMAEKSRYGFKSLSNLTKNDEEFKGLIYDDRTSIQKKSKHYTEQSIHLPKKSYQIPSII